jgi:hypothetical protein
MNAPNMAIEGNGFATNRENRLEGSLTQEKGAIGRWNESWVLSFID